MRKRIPKYSGNVITSSSRTARKRTPVEKDRLSKLEARLEKLERTKETGDAGVVVTSAPVLSPQPMEIPVLE